MAQADVPSTVSTDALQFLYKQLDCAESDAGGKVTITGADPVAPSVHRVGDASAAALAAFGTEVSALWRARGGDGQDVAVSIDSALRQLTAVFFTSVNGVSIFQIAEDPHLFHNTGFYRSATGRFFHVVLTYPALRDIACDLLDCPPSRDRIADAIARWDPFELEEAICSRGGSAAAVRTQQEWREHPQGQLLDKGPLIHIEKISDSAPEPFPEIDLASAAGPLAGLRVLDNTHVIAGPVAARMFAELGADVLHLSAPGHPDSNSMIIDTGIGKRAAFCDLLNPVQAHKFWQVLAEADVYANSYLNLDVKGFGPLALIERRPGLVVLDYQSWGTVGPWSRRGGFDQPVCAATGIAVETGSFDGPQLPPTHLLNDYMASFLGAAGAIEALRRREREGGSYRVHIDLAKISMWVQDLGLFPRSKVSELPHPQLGGHIDGLASIDGPWGTISYLPTQISYSTLAPRLTRSSEPLGAAPLAWW